MTKYGSPTGKPVAPFYITLLRSNVFPGPSFRRSRTGTLELRRVIRPKITGLAVRADISRSILFAFIPGQAHGILRRRIKRNALYFSKRCEDLCFLASGTDIKVTDEEHYPRKAD